MGCLRKRIVDGQNKNMEVWWKSTPTTTSKTEDIQKAGVGGRLHGRWAGQGPVEVLVDELKSWLSRVGERREGRGGVGHGLGGGSGGRGVTSMPATSVRQEVVWDALMSLRERLID